MSLFKRPTATSCWLLLFITFFATVAGYAQDDTAPAADTTAPRDTTSAATRPTPTPQPVATAKPTPKPKPAIKPKATPKPKPTPSPTPRPKPTATPRPQPTATPVLQPTATPVPKPSPTPLPKPTPTPVPKPAAASDVEDIPLSDPGVPTVAVPSTAPTAKESKQFKTQVNPMATATPLPGATPTPVASPTPLATGTPVPETTQPEDAAPPSANTDEEAPGGAFMARGDGAPTDFASVWGQDFMREALFAGVLVALVCGYLGVYVVLKRIVFIGVALSEFSSAGIAIALLAGFSPLLGALAFVLMGVVLFALRLSPRRVPNESFIGIVYVIAGALAILLISKSHAGETHMLQLLQGDVLLIDPSETRQMMAVFGAIAAVHILFIKPLVLTSFDRDAASTLGFRSGAWDFLLFLTIGLGIAFAIRACGTLMTTTMLIIPAVTALLLVNRLKWAFVAAPLIAAAPVAIGLHISFVADLPASAVIVALSFLLLLPALAFNALAKR